MAELLRSTARVRLTGAEPWRCLRSCAESGILLKDIREEDPVTVVCSLALRDLPRAERCARRSGCSLTVLSQTGPAIVRRRIKRNRFFLTAAALLFLALAASSLFVWDISVTENDSEYPDSAILRALSEQGIGPGSFWPAFRQERIRTRALLSLPELRYLAVNVRAGRAEVIVRRAVPAPEIFDPARPGDVTAAAAGIIASVTVLEGESAVKRGEAVSPGQTLIAGTPAAPHARGEVRAYTWHELTALSPLTVWEKTSSGPEKRRFALIVGTNRINFYADSGILPADCVKMTVIRPLAVENAFTLPVRWVTEILRPYTVQSRQADPEALRLRLEAELTHELVRRLGDRGEIVKTYFTCRNDGGTLTVTLRAECLERIDSNTANQEK